MAPIAYVPIAQNASPFAWAAVIVRSELPTAAVRMTIARRIEQLKPSIATHVVDLQTRVRERLVGERVVAWLAGAFGALAIILVVLGLYGILAYIAVSRTKEIAIRLALGATRTEIARLFVREHLSLLAGGLGIGLAVVSLVASGASALLFQVTPLNVPTLAAATGALALAGLLAGALPVWRAARMPPEIALRWD